MFADERAKHTCGDVQLPEVETFNMHQLEGTVYLEHFHPSAGAEVSDINGEELHQDMVAALPGVVIEIAEATGAPESIEVKQVLRPVVAEC